MCVSYDRFFVFFFFIQKVGALVTSREKKFFMESRRTSALVFSDVQES